MTPTTLQEATGCTTQLAELYSPHIAAAFEHWEISTPLRQAHWLTQASHESSRFTRIEEYLDYRAERLCAIWPRRFPSLDFARNYAHAPRRLANYVYFGRNGNRASDDGWMFRGRGLGQLTGRNNYAAYSAAAQIDAVTQPDIILQPEHAVGSFAWFFKANNCLHWADKDDLGMVRECVNGKARLGYEECAPLLARAKAALQ